jgi:hypothetical protein
LGESIVFFFFSKQSHLFKNKIIKKWNNRFKKIDEVLLNFNQIL